MIRELTRPSPLNRARQSMGRDEGGEMVNVCRKIQQEVAVLSIPVTPKLNSYNLF